MNPLVDGKIQPPIDAWGAFFDHFDKEVAEGRETPESARSIYDRAAQQDWDADMRKHAQVDIEDAIRNIVNEAAKAVVAAVVEIVLADMEKNKAPFWANKWRGQR